MRWSIMEACRKLSIAVAVFFTLVVCLPGGKSECTEKSCRQNMTCCELPEGGEGCCPFKNAMCCLDGIHCCPFGTVCDTEHGRCVEGDVYRKEHFQFVELTTTNTSFSLSNERCPDGSICPGVTTCCMMTTKHYGCCPYQYGVCCRDKIHCCPQGTHCSGGGMCFHPGPVPEQENEVVGLESLFSEQALITTAGCNGGNKCAQDNTCCTRRDGSVGCCPMKDAVCCPKLDSCCPKGYMCSPYGCIKSKA